MGTKVKLGRPAGAPTTQIRVLESAADIIRKIASSEDATMVDAGSRMILAGAKQRRLEKKLSKQRRKK